MQYWVENWGKIREGELDCHQNLIDWFMGHVLHFLIIADCLLYTAVHLRRSGLSCCRCLYLEQCRCLYLEQSASTWHNRTLYVCFLRTSEGFPLQAFLSLTRYRNFCSAVIFGHLNRSFYLLTYLLTPPKYFIRIRS